MVNHNEKAPVLFIGHGSPMNALENNLFTQSLHQLRTLYPNPKAILCISAHWMTEGTWVTHMKYPKTIHDFYGFPPELFAIQYPALGHPEMAELIQSKINNPRIRLDEEDWGLDHGTWSVLRHIYPDANVPVIQLSLDLEQPPQYHYELGTQLKFLRDHGVLILGSGNIVHNLRMIRWEKNAKPYDWAIEFDEWLKEKLLKREFNSLINEVLNSEAGRLSIPTFDHYFPILYVLGASDEKDILRFSFEEIHNGSISMRTFSMVSNRES